jgi:hypothetical protein
MFSPIVAIRFGDHVADGLALGGLGRRDGVDVAVHAQGHGRDFARGVWNVAFLDTKSVSAFSSTHAGLAVGAHLRRHQAFGRGAVGLLGGLGQALGAQPVHGRVQSPPFSCSAFLQSIMPTPDFSRRSLTSAAVISAMVSSFKVS